MIPGDLRHRLRLHAAKGGKTARGRQIRRVEAFVRWCGCDPRQIGRGHVHRFFAAHAHAASTQRDYWYAIKLLWQALGRPGEPPKPVTRTELTL